MKLKTTIIFALALVLVFLFSHGELSPANARELQQKVVSISSASDKELGKTAEATDPIISPLKYSGSSSKPAAALRFA